MKTQLMKRKQLLVAGLGILLVVIFGVSAWAFTRSTPESSDQDNKDGTEIIDITDSLSSRPLQLTTNDAYVRYLEKVTNNPIISEGNIHLDSTVDWNTEVLTVIEVSRPSSQAFLDFVVGKVDGKEAYIIESLAPGKDCIYTQDMQTHVAFVSEPRDDADSNRPVIVRLQANEASCPKI